jgi:dTDP-glucose 4,6-dehydratase
MNWASKRVAVTGAGGFIGSHLVEALVAAGADVSAIVRYNSRSDDGNLGFLPPDVREAVTIHRIDLTDIDASRRALSGADIVFNLAAYIGIPYSYVSPQDTVTNNMATTMTVLLLARENAIGKVMQTSTSEVYGSARIVPIPETHPLQPQSPYSASKIATDSVALSFHYSYNIPLVIVRPFNTYGPRQSARAVIPSVAAQALAGSEIRVGAVDTTRDFNYVGDTVRGFMMCAASDQAVGEVINIGSGQEISIAHTIDEIVKIAGRNARVVRDEARIRPEKSEVTRLWADISKARSVLGYEPEVSLREGLERTVAWIREHSTLYRPAAYTV